MIFLDKINLIMKPVLFIFFYLSISLCFAQKNTFKLRDDQLRDIKKRTVFVNKYADSLNTYSCDNCKILPSFFYESNFDKKNTVNWLSMHLGVSLRKLIVDKITNSGLLKAVLKSKDKRLKKRTKIPKKIKLGDIVLPFQEYSTYDLVKYRLQELLNDDFLGKGASNYPKQQ
jgi:hypothetical protein